MRNETVCGDANGGVGVGTGRAGAPRRALATLFGMARAGAVCGALAGCGGGGGDGAPSASPAPVAAPAPAAAASGPLAAVLWVTAPVGYNADRLAAFDRLNAIRLSAGLGLLAQNAVLDQAAQAHADWEIANDTYAHAEAAGTSGFTGVNWWNRDEALGYAPLGGAELLSSGVGAAAAVDGLVNVVYHRAALLAFEPLDVGIGWSGAVAGKVSQPLVMDLTRPADDPVRSLGQAAQAAIAGVAVWPLDGAVGVATRMGAENPDPVPGVDVGTLGTPASITVSSALTIAATSFRLTHAGTGVDVPAIVLSNSNDPNFLLPPSFIALVPVGPLQADTTYAVSFTGSVVDGALGTPRSLSKAWTFSTGSQ